MTNRISFFVPITYPNHLAKSFPIGIRLLVFVDRLLPNLQGRGQAELSSSVLLNDRCYPVHLVERNSSVWVTILKIVFFTTFRSVAVFFLITKIILRCYYFFSLISDDRVLKVQNVQANCSLRPACLIDEIRINHDWEGPLQGDEKKRLKLWVSKLQTRNEFILKKGNVCLLHIVNEDLLKIHADLIVNAANIELGGGSGVDGAIHAAGEGEYANNHRSLQNYCSLSENAFQSGHAMMIRGGKKLVDIGVHKVIVVAGPKVKNEGDFMDAEQKSSLYSCIYNSLLLAVRYNASLKNKIDSKDQIIKEIAFPAISTGIYNVSFSEFIEVFITALARCNFKCDPKYRPKVKLCLFPSITVKTVREIEKFITYTHQDHFFDAQDTSLLFFPSDPS